MPLLQQEPIAASLRNPGSPADQALAKIVDLLGRDGYDLTLPAWMGDAYLKISNALESLTELTISSNGNVTWEYRSIRGRHVDAAKITTIAITLLDPEAEIPALSSRGRSAMVLNLKSVRRALLRHGLTADRLRSDPDGFTILTLVNPYQPARGAVDITNDGGLIWQTRAPHHRDGGLVLPDIAGRISLALARAQHYPSNAK